MPSLVVDASAIVDLLIGSPVSGVLFDRFIRSGDVLHAPHSIDVEVAHAVRRLWLRGLISDSAMDDLIVIYPRLNIFRHPLGALLRRIWDLRHNVASYDAAYVALAELLDAPLITRDARLARSSGHAARIEYID